MRRAPLPQLTGAHPAAIGGADESIHTGASNEVDRNVFFFEDSQNADVSQTARKAAAEGQTDPHPCRLGIQACGVTGKAASERLHRTNNLIQTLHGGPHTIPGFARLLSSTR